MKNNKAAQRKAVMRLCAFAMAHDNEIAQTEEEVILEIIQKREYNAKNDAKQFYEECKESLLNDTMQQQSIFVNIDSLDKTQICNELNDFVKIAKADNALIDSEREAFVLICKLFKVRQSRTLWKIALERNLDVKDIVQKTMMSIEDYRNIKKILGFYAITGPIVKGTRHVLQMEYIKRNDVDSFKEHLITHKAFLLFCSVAFLLFIHAPSMNHLLNSEHTNYLTAILISLVLVVWSAVAATTKKKKQKRSISDFNKSFKVVTWCAFSMALLSGFVYHDMWVLSMMISIEWLIFMREKHSSQEHNHTTMLVVLVVMAIIADIALGVTEMAIEKNKFTWNIISAPIFLGCICFFFGKWLENNNTKQQDELKEMEATISMMENTQS